MTWNLTRRMRDEIRSVRGALWPPSFKLLADNRGICTL
jgi:hypothetical protein